MMIELSNNQISILGKPNFACAPIAKLLIKHSIYEDKENKAEYEQAVFIHWASDLLEKFGDGWVDEAKRIIDKLLEAESLINHKEGDE
jgi:hypothetical protein